LRRTPSRAGRLLVNEPSAKGDDPDRSCHKLDL
jgi:hypothetical protein